MKIIVAGAGEVGAYLAQLLCNDKHDVVVIDVQEENLRPLDNRLDILTIKGSATSIQILKEAGIKRTDLLIAVTHKEEVNITAAILGKRLGAKKTIVRIDNSEYLQPGNKEYFESIGIDSMIYPQKLAARTITQLLKETGTTEMFEFSGGKLAMFVVKLEKDAPIVNKTLIEATQEFGDIDYRAVAISRSGRTIIPGGSNRFLYNDLVYVVTNQNGIKSIMKYSGKKHFDVKNIMILGGSRIGMKTAKELEDHFNVKLLEIDKDKCYALAEDLSNALIINADGRNISVLEEEGIAKMDAFIAVTGNSETNILSCLLAKKFGVHKTIAEIENIDYIDLADNIGLDTVINKKQIAASHIFRFTVDAKVTSVRCLTGSDAEVLEFVVQQKAEITKRQLKDIHFPKDAIIGGVIRGKSYFIAKGDCRIHAKDKVIVFALPSAINKVSRFFN